MTLRKRWHLFLAAFVLAILVLAGCTEGDDASKADIKEPKFTGEVLPSDYEARTPDKLTVYQNVDGHPTIVRVCIDGVGFRTISTTHAGGLDGSVARVPEWDDYCAAP